MFCYKCGTQLQDGSLYCSKCGAKQNGNSTQPVKYEYCEIVYQTRLGRNLLQQTQFWVQAVNQNGMYSAAESQWLNGLPWETPPIDVFKLKKKQQDAVDIIIRQLQKKGWEILAEKGNKGWWSYKFRRQLT